MAASTRNGTIQNVFSGMNLAYEGNLIQVDQGNHNTQWQLVPVSGSADTYHMKNVHNNEFLASSEAGTLIQQPATTGTPRERWQARPAPGSTDAYYLVNLRWAEYPLSAVPAGAGGYPGVILYQDQRQQNQWWTLPPLARTAPVRTWGYNADGRLGDGTTNHRTTPVSVCQGDAALTGIQTLAPGGYHSLALTADGTVLAWGNNSKGQLGDGTTTNRTTPVVLYRGGLPLTGIQTLAAGGYHSLAVTAEGGVLAWGYNSDGQLGDGTTTPRTAPVTVSQGGAALTGIRALAAGHSHSLALTAEGGVLAWGDNAYGQLGDGTTTDRYTPVTLYRGGAALTGIRALAAGYSHSLALTAEGTVLAWGDNNHGQLGDGTTTPRTAPVTVSQGGVALTGIQTLAAGWHHSLALTADGTVLAWGYNLYGQLGDGTTTPRTAPVTVPQGGTALTGIQTLAAGSHHSLALTANGTVLAWGHNLYGQLGDGTTTPRTAPVTVSQGGAALTGIQTLAAGGFHSLVS